ncbi:MAG: hypothetical protein KO202_06245 [Methanobacteriaceae archaeon]|jgi:predicted outer membrane repeat protein|nr:hypothetical protein [Methanobacteriaceae archaeon]
MKNFFYIFFLLIFSLSIASVQASDDLEFYDLNNVEENDENIIQETNANEDPLSFQDLQKSIKEVKDGGSLGLGKGFKVKDYERNAFKEGIVIDKPITIYGNGHTIDGDNQVRLFKITGNNVTLKNLNLINGLSDNGGAIYASGNGISIENCTLKDNNANENGGAVYNNNGYSFIVSYNTIFENNTAQSNGGAIYNSGINFKIIGDNIFKYNKAIKSDGGVIYNTGDSLLINGYNTFINNNAKNYGGAIYNKGKNSQINGNNSFWYNEALNGGSIYNNNLFLINSSNFMFNEAKDGKDIYNDISGDLNIINSVFNNIIYNKGKLFQENNTSIGNLSIFNTNLLVNDVSMFYLDGTKLEICLTDINNNSVVNQTIKICINGKWYYRVTDSKGYCYMNLNLNPGKYDITALFDGTPSFAKSFKNSTMVIKTLIYGEDIVMYYKDGTRYKAQFLASDGSPLKNKEVSFNVNGVFYKRTTDENGFAFLNINLYPKEYIITAIHPNGLMESNKIVISTRLYANNVSMSSNNRKTYDVHLLDTSGNPLANKLITINIHGVFYYKNTDSNGIARLNINLNPGTYIATAYYEDYASSNNVTVI